MRGARWFLLAAILVILGSVGLTYVNQRRDLENGAPQRPEPLPLDIGGRADDWHWKQTDKGRPVVEIWARNFKQEKESSSVELQGVRLHIFHKDEEHFDRVESSLAVFHPSEDKLFSEGDVAITLAVPAEGEPARQLVAIRTSGVTFESKTGRASTDRAAEFTFQNGTGKSVGATYDPSTRELQLRGSVELNWQSPKPKSKPMKLESGELIYKEKLSQILLFPWARLKRDSSVVQSGDAIVSLKDGAIQTVEAKDAKGVDEYPQRRLEYAADQMLTSFNEDGEVDKVTGEHNARLVSASEASRTTMTSDRVLLDFEMVDGQSNLKTALGLGHGVIESKPLPGAGPLMPETRILRSEALELKMRPGGRDMELLTANAPGRLEFLPNRAGQRKREMDGDRMWIAYGERNMVQSFRSVNVTTVSHALKPADPPANTSSKNLLADFDPKTGQMTRMRQWDDFQYNEGTRKAVAKQAVLENDSSKITLESTARVWDPTGSTSADTIRLDQTSGNFVAEGRVTSSRVQDKKDPSSGFLRGDEPVQAMASRMTSTNQNKFIKYEGNAVLWQGSSRVKGDTIEIDREARRLVARNKVETQLLEKRKEDKAAPRTSGGFTFVKSTGLVYTEADRLAYYTGGVLLTQPNLRVKSAELRAFLAEPGAESSLDKAFADGAVEIVQTASGRTRKGVSEHAEYYVPNEKIILRGGSPLLTDSLKGNTRGSELTYFTGDDRLLVNGKPERPATSLLHRK